MAQIHILVAEDDPHIRMGLNDTLESEGYAVTQARDGSEALTLFQNQAVDLVILDVMMPEKSGYDVCLQIRRMDQQIPVIMLTAKSEEIDKVVGLELGADDYMTKPFGIHELLARIKAVLRRSNRGEEDLPGLGRQHSFVFGQCKVNPQTFKLACERDGQNRQTDLSEREVKLLCCFFEHAGKVLSRDAILNAVWGIDYLGTTRTLDQHIAKLRKKIEPDPSRPTVITTIHGVGYRYEGPPAEKNIKGPES